MRLTRTALLASCLVVFAAAEASADATLFLGSTTTPSARAAKGVALGMGLLVVGFEFEYSATDEDLAEGAPSLRTGMGNMLLQTPVAILRMQPYFTVGGGGYREELGTERETHVGVNSGGGVKVSLLGPLRVRLDYRVFKLRGSPVYETVHRFYAGANLKF